MRLARNDLEQVRMLTEQVRKRERKKLDRVVLLRDIVDRLLYPLERKMREILKVMSG
jgi:NuA3 HAT complex component NTO1